jgi:outer membrane lipoprotein LolB
LLSACQSLPTLLSKNTDPDQQWQQRQLQLGQLQQWHLTGRVSIFKQEDAWHASLDWQQQPQSYLIQFIAPMGGGSAILSGDPTNVIMRTSDNETFIARNAEQLLMDHMGWTMPVEGMRYWAVGLPSPASKPQRQQLDEEGRLLQLSQFGWDIEYRRYTSVGEMDLPDKIFMQNHKLNVKLVVERWQLSDVAREARRP